MPESNDHKKVTFYIIVRNCFLIAIVIAMAFLFGSCGNTRQLTYLQGQFDTAKLSQVHAIEP
ncbi:MAG TPA: hypothetical protein VMH01_11130, partial [Puia sp.]|nr:hypothetical protein [Puia sp.]